MRLCTVSTFPPICWSANPENPDDDGTQHSRDSICHTVCFSGCTNQILVKQAHQLQDVLSDYRYPETLTYPEYLQG